MRVTLSMHSRATTPIRVRDRVDGVTLPRFGFSNSFVNVKYPHCFSVRRFYSCSDIFPITTRIVITMVMYALACVDVCNCTNINHICLFELVSVIKRVLLVFRVHQSFQIIILTYSLLLIV